VPVPKLPWSRKVLAVDYNRLVDGTSGAVIDQSTNSVVAAPTNGAWVVANARSVPTIAGRRYRCSWSGSANGTTGGEFCQTRVTVNGAVPTGMPTRVQTQLPAAAGADGLVAGEVYFVAASTGNQTVNLEFTRNTGGTQVNVTAGSVVFTIADVGT